MDEMTPLTDGGWIKLNRSIQDSFIWSFDHPQYGLAWIDMLMLANYKDKQILFNGKLQTIKRGSFVTSIVKLSERWRMNRRTVKNFLDLLKSDGMITYECTRYCTTVCIVNYERYQGFFEFDGSDSAQGNAQQNAQQSAQQNAQQSAHNIRKKEQKELKELNNKDYRHGAETTPAPPDPPKQSSPVVISILLNDKTEYRITEADVAEWKELYQAVDIMQELRKMKGWADANPSKRKTRKGIKRFINSWLSKEQDKYHGPQGGGQFGGNPQNSGTKYGTCI